MVLSNVRWKLRMAKGDCGIGDTLSVKVVFSWQRKDDAEGLALGERE
jgi:hypothetical protein